MKKEKKSLIEKLGGVINIVGNAVMMNLLFLVACLPIVTIGQAWCGLLGAIRYNIRGEKWFVGFKTGYKTRFWRGTVIWCVGLVICYILLGDISQAIEAKAYGMMSVSWVMFAFVAMLLQSAFLLNVYIYTDVNNWLKNTVNLLFRGFMSLLLCAGLFWLPVILLLLVDAWLIYECVMILVFAYFSLSALVCTMTMKDALTGILIDCRAEGLIIAEEGASSVQQEESGEEE